ncbi:tetratricopeptide repeat protein [uncultured Planktomarina sp.]|uniref:tetratricopeptide repeat protein n=1 Tax=uncultured Planktomarina sp. TaxID=1538529 RepID=UPI00326041D8
MKRSAKIIYVMLLSMTLGASAAAQQASGPYIAARQAALAHDYQPAADYFARALAQSPRDSVLVSQTMTAFLASGDVKKSHALARLLVAGEGSYPLAEVLVLSEHFKRNDYQAALDHLEATTVVGRAIDELLEGWALVGLGQMAEALRRFDAVIPVEGMRSFALYQKGLALTLVGDFEGAAASFSGQGQAAPALNYRGSLVWAQILVQLDRSDDALAFLRDFHGSGADHAVNSLMAQIEAGALVEFDLLRNASEGAGEVLHLLAQALQNGEGQDGLLLYTRLASHMAPRNMQAVLLSAQLLEQLGNPQLAIETYTQVPRSHPAYVQAELGRAQALQEIGEATTAIEVLTQLAGSFENLRSIHMTLGDFLRQDEQYARAVRSYDRAIALIDQPARGHWYLHYVRGTAHDRLGDWAAAMRDFDRALELAPDQFQVLNYVGYTLVDRGEQLDEALEMIQKAVAAQPDAGYIIDSLGWAQYRLGFYNEAVVHMERAAELMATDPIVNDHLGDVYWAVGRKTEARFQWRRALSFAIDYSGAEAVDPKRIQRKLEVGLAEVLAEEGAAPLKVADGD